MLGFGKRKSVSPGNIAAVVSGQIIPIEKVKDEAFAKKMMGDGVAIVPSDDYIVSPCDEGMVVTATEYRKRKSTRSQSSYK